MEIRNRDFSSTAKAVNLEWRILPLVYTLFQTDDIAWKIHNLIYWEHAVDSAKKQWITETREATARITGAWGIYFAVRFIAAFLPGPMRELIL